ncbi:MAG: histidinol-phosphatase [Clostridia bacterium]|nr:histidinol-phosphatase [Clostridia bacterium]
MIANFHTHTNYCDHAKGSPEDCVLAALEAGLSELGFSEHIPYIFPDGHESGFRMKRADLKAYVEDVKALKVKYADKIKIHLGLEVEYYPALFDRTMESVKGLGIEYILLGQHFLNDKETVHGCSPKAEEEHIKTYTELVCEGMRRGVFTYLCHPDMINYVGDDEIYKKYAKIICETAKECDVPIEFNLLGYLTGRCYPNEKFFSVVAEVGNDVVLGIDAHEPERFYQKETELSAIKFLNSLGITPKEKITIKKPF